MDINQQYLMGLWILNYFESTYTFVYLSSKIACKHGSYSKLLLYLLLHDFKYKYTLKSYWQPLKVACLYLKHHKNSLFFGILSIQNQNSELTLVRGFKIHFRYLSMSFLQTWQLVYRSSTAVSLSQQKQAIEASFYRQRPECVGRSAPWKTELSHLCCTSVSCY